MTFNTNKHLCHEWSHSSSRQYIYIFCSFIHFQQAPTTRRSQTSCKATLIMKLIWTVNKSAMAHAAITSQRKTTNVKMTHYALTSILHQPDARVTFLTVAQLSRMGLLALWFVPFNFNLRMSTSLTRCSHFLFVFTIIYFVLFSLFSFAASSFDMLKCFCHLHIVEGWMGKSTLQLCDI